VRATVLTEQLCDECRAAVEREIREAVAEASAYAAHAPMYPDENSYVPRVEEQHDANLITAPAPTPPYRPAG